MVPLPAAAPESPAVDPAALPAALREWFGFDAFRPGQEAVIRAVLDGQDTLALMPTGAGKSLCYQLPAMLLPGCTLVISPLIALMKDQYDNLPAPVYARSTFVNSSLDVAEVERRMADVHAGRVKLIYAAPERLRQQPFLHALARAGLSLLVIDEAHCVSLWGHDFRPDYLFIGKALPALGAPRLLGMTATATAKVQAEIGAQLGRALRVVQTNPFRPNLFYQVQHLPQQKEKIAALVRFCRDHKGSGIVYVRSRKLAEQMAAILAHAGVPAEHYHAGIESSERSAVQERWMLDRTRVIVATIAFGMGIDKKNVRFIVHFSPPDSVESYAQESGRAGRDGRPAICLMLATPGDRANLTRWLRQEAIDLDRLRAIYAAVGQQVRATGRPTLVNAGALLREAGLRVPGGQELSDTELRVGIGLLERVDLFVRHADAPATATVQAEGALFLAPDPAFDAFCAACELRPGRRWEGALDDLARRLDTDPLTLERRLLDWRDAGRITLRSGPREPVIERLPPPADTRARLGGLLQDYEKAQLERIDGLFGYTASEECRHQVLARHLGHDLAPCGESCDNCKSGRARHAAPPRSAAERATDVEALFARIRAGAPAFRGTPLTVKRALAIVDCVASQPFAVTKTALAKVLTGRDGAPFTPTQVHAFGALQGDDRYDVPKQIDALVALGYLRADESSGKRLIELGRPDDVVARPAGAPAAGRAGAAESGDGWASPVLGRRSFATFDEPLEVPDLPANPARIMVECVASLPFPMGRTGVARVLTGSSTSAVEPERCRHFGALSMCTQAAVAEAFLPLIRAGYLRQESRDTRPLLFLTAQAEADDPPADLVRLEPKAGFGAPALQRQAAREAARHAAYAAAAGLAGPAAAFPDDEVADRLERLRLWRRTTAQREGVPPFMIFHDRVLEALAAAAIATTGDLLAVRGVGQIAIGKYGPALLEILAAPGEPDGTTEPRSTRSE